MAAAAATKKEPELNIYQRINAISQEAGALAPVAKGGVPFAFRGIDGTVAHVTPFMHKYGVFNTSRVISHLVTERELANGKIVKTTQVEVEFEFFAPDGTSVTSVTPGLADDFGDRSSAQAMSVAYRIALLQIFHLPTHSPDPEETGQTVMDGAASSGGAATPKAVATAQRANAAVPVAKLQAQARAHGEALGMGPEDLNALLAKHAGGSSEPFADAGVMSKVVAELKAEVEAKK